MEISIDNRKTDIIYVDKANLSTANNDEVIKLICKYNNNSVEVLSGIFAGIYNLNKLEELILTMLLNADEELEIKDVVEILMVMANKSKITINRAIETLRNKRLAYTNRNKIKASNHIAIKDKDINKIKALIIEII